MIGTNALEAGANEAGTLDDLVGTNADGLGASVDEKCAKDEEGVTTDDLTRTKALGGGACGAVLNGKGAEGCLGASWAVFASSGVRMSKLWRKAFALESSLSRNEGPCGSVAAAYSTMPINTRETKIKAKSDHGLNMRGLKLRPLCWFTLLVSSRIGVQRSMCFTYSTLVVF